MEKMMGLENRKILFLVLSYFLLSGFVGPARADDSGNDLLRISGSTTLLPISQRAAEMFMGESQNKHIKLSVSGTGTGDGIRALIEGVVDMAGASRDLKSREELRAKEYGVELIRHVVALDCLAVVVHPDNPVNGLSLDELQGIYDGSIKNWKEVGGQDKIIVPINRDASSGTFEMWINRILKGQRARRDAQVQSSGGGVAFAVAGNRYAVGYVGLGFLSEEIKPLAIEGVMPSVVNVQNGTYPISRELYMFTREDIGPARHFLEFLSGPAGLALIRQEGFVPPPESIF